MTYDRLTKWALVVYFVCVAFLIVFGVRSAMSHDIYMHLHEKMDMTKMLCCGGDEKIGDCEAVEYQMLPSGDAIFTSKRYGAKIRIAKEKIGWFAVPGGEANEAHWCGRPSNGIQSSQADQIDPNFVTYCAFIAAGGV